MNVFKDFLRDTGLNRVQECIKNMIEFHPLVTRPIEGWGISSNHQKNSLVMIWDLTDAYFSSKGYSRSKLGMLKNLLADSES